MSPKARQGKAGPEGGFFFLRSGSNPKRLSGFLVSLWRLHQLAPSHSDGEWKVSWSLMEIWSLERKVEMMERTWRERTGVVGVGGREARRTAGLL